MLKPLVFTACLVVLATVACTSMSLEEYAEECGEWEEDYGDRVNIAFSSSLSASDLDDLEEALQDWNALSPPGEVKAFHEVRAEGLQILLDNAREWEELEDRLDDLRDELDDAPRSQRAEIRDRIDDLSDEQEDLVDDLRDLMDDLSDDYEDALDELPRRVERDLEDEGCI